MFGSKNALSNHSNSKCAPKEELIEALQEFVEDIGRVPTAEQMRVDGPYGVKIYKKSFGSWNNAIIRAGFETNDTHYTDEQIIAAIRAVDDKLDRTPTIAEMDEHGVCSGILAQKRFDGWTDAVKQAGLDPNVNLDPSDEELLDEMRRLADEENRLSSEKMTSEGKFGVNAYLRTFGSWNEALQEAGLDVALPRNLSDERLLKSLTELAKNLGRTPTQKDMSEHGPHTIDPYLSRWGTWNETLGEIGLEPNQAFYTEEELLEHLREFAEEIGKTPTTWEMEVEGPHSLPTYQNRFGSWNNALQAAGFEPRRETHISNEVLLAALRMFASELGETPTPAQMNEDGPHGASTYAIRFGSWRRAVSEAGLPHFEEETPSKQELLDEIVLCSDLLGHPPTKGEIKEAGDYGLKWYRLRFGSWNGALIAAGMETAATPPTCDELIGSIQDAAEELGHAPRMADMVERGEYPAEAYLNEFGTWKSAVREAGYTPLKSTDPDKAAIVTRYYGPNWPKQRAKARERDGHKCRECGMGKDEHIESNGGDLPVHHRQPFHSFAPFETQADYDEANSLSNLLTFCVKHHHKWERLPVQPPADI